MLTITRRGQLNNRETPKSIFIALCLTCIITTVVRVSKIFHLFLRFITPSSQAFYGYRLTKCFKKPYCAFLCWVVIISHFLVYLAYLTATMWKLDISLFWVSVAGFYATGTVDILMATFLCYYLIKNRRDTVLTRSVTLQHIV